MLSHARALLTGNGAPTSYIDADARDTAKILAEASDLLDLSQPTAVMMIAVLHCIPDSDDRTGSSGTCSPPSRRVASWPSPTRPATKSI